MNIENLNLKPIDLEEVRKQIFKPLYKSVPTWKSATTKRFYLQWFSLIRVGTDLKKHLLELSKTIL